MATLGFRYVVVFCGEKRFYSSTTLHIQTLKIDGVARGLEPSKTAFHPDLCETICLKLRPNSHNSPTGTGVGDASALLANDAAQLNMADQTLCDNEQSI